MLQRCGFQPAFYPLCTIRTLFSNLKDPVPLEGKSGVYSLPCDNCNAVYIGETGRSFAIRLHEHIDQRPSSLSFSKHLQQEKHAFKKGSETLLHVENSHSRRLALESLESARHRSQGWNVLNYSCPSKGLIDILFPPPTNS